jgi:hypothetical protein
MQTTALKGRDMAINAEELVSQNSMALMIGFPVHYNRAGM